MKKKMHENIPVINRAEGLVSSEVLIRKENKLQNKTSRQNQKTYAEIIFQNLFTFFNLILFAIAATYIVVGIVFKIDTLLELNNFTFLGVVIQNVLIGIIQEIKQKKIVDKLSIVNQSKALVIRDDEEQEIPVREIVRDDVILFKLGDQVPVDCMIFNGAVEANEQVLTGENHPVKKQPDDILLAGSFIVSGQCRAFATAVGDEQYQSKLQKKAKEMTNQKSMLMVQINKIIKVVTVILIPLGILNALKIYFSNESVLGNLRRILAPIVGMIPCGMILLTSVALATGIIRLQKQKTLIQDLYQIEMLARVDTLCFDKTGTITDGQMSIERINTLDKDVDINLIMNEYLAETGTTTPTAKALASKYQSMDRSLEVINKIPFQSARKYDAVEFNDGNVYILGAPDYINKIKNECISDELNYYIDNENAEGLRTILLAKQSGKIKDMEITGKITPVAVFSLKDNVRENAEATFNWFYENDVDIKVISGDNPVTVARVQKLAGVRGADRVVQLADKDDDFVRSVANEYSLFARVSPEQKAILVKAMKDAGHVVGITGDGVNDILAMKESNCGIAMGHGADAARQAANIVLLDQDFSNMPKVVNEGRRVVNNIQRQQTMFIMKTVMVMLLTLFTLLPFAQGYPFIHQNLMAIEICTAGLGQLMLALEPNQCKIEGNFLRQIFLNAVPAGIFLACGAALSAVVDAVGLMEVAGISWETCYVIVVSFCQIFVLLVNCMPLNRYRRILVISMLCLCAAVIFLPVIFPVLEELLCVVSSKDMAGATYAAIPIIIGSICTNQYIYIGLLKLRDRIFKKDKK